MSKDPHIANIFSAADDEDCLSLEQLAAYQEGRVQGPERNRMERHLLDCELCAITLESIAEHGADSIQAGAEEVTERAWTKLEQRERRKRRGAFFWIAAAASVAILITVGFFTLGGPTDEQFDKAINTAEAGTPPLPPDTGSGSAIAMNRVEESAPTESTPEEQRVNEAMKPQAEPLPSVFGGGKSMSPTPGNAAGPHVTLAESRARNDGGSVAGSDPGMLDFEPDFDNGVDRSASRENPSQPLFTNATKSPQVTDKIQPAPSPVIGMENSKSDAKGGLGKGSAKRKAEAEKALPAKDAMNDQSFAVTATEEQVAMDDMASEDAGDEVRTTNEVGITDGTQSMGNRVVESRDFKKLESKSERSKPAGRTTTAPAMADAKPSPDVYTQGMNAYQQGNYRDAAANFRKATELTPNNLQAHLYAADAFLRISQPQAALFHCERILSQPGNSAVEDAEWFKALAYLQLKEGRKAKAQLETVIARNGKYKTLAEEALAKLR